MSDLAAVRIHSKTTSIFSSRPIISRKRCTEGDCSSSAIVARRFEERDEQARPAGSTWPRSGGVLGRITGELADKAALVQFAQPVLDVQAQPPEDLHQRLGVEARFRLRVKVAKQPGAERRLHECAEPCIDVTGIAGSHRAGRALAARTEDNVVHLRTLSA